MLGFTARLYLYITNKIWKSTIDFSRSSQQVVNDAAPRMS